MCYWNNKKQNACRLKPSWLSIFIKKLIIIRREWKIARLRRNLTLKTWYKISIQDIPWTTAGYSIQESGQKSKQKFPVNFGTGILGELNLLGEFTVTDSIHRQTSILLGDVFSVSLELQRGLAWNRSWSLKFYQNRYTYVYIL